VVEVRAFAVNPGEASLIEQRPNGWRPGQHVAGVVLHAAADGSGPPVAMAKRQVPGKAVLTLS
jgi:NADPH:quinone reductase